MRRSADCQCKAYQSLNGRAHCVGASAAGDTQMVVRMAATASSYPASSYQIRSGQIRSGQIRSGQIRHT